MSKPTPRPWNVELDGDTLEYVLVGDHSDVAADLSEANAAHIVKCVNMHDELVELLRRANDEWFMGLNAGKAARSLREEIESLLAKADAK